MRQFVAEFGRDEDKVCQEYVLAEKRDEAPRKNNKSGLNSEEYARALWRDRERRNWF
jgi:hypothetical protein